MNIEIEQLKAAAAAAIKKAEEISKTLSDPATGTLDERWEKFRVIAPHMPCNAYGDGDIALLGRNVSLYDDFYIERYETTDYEDMWTLVKERIGDKWTQEQADVWREATLVSGYGSFTNSW